MIWTQIKTIIKPTIVKIEEQSTKVKSMASSFISLIKSKNSKNGFLISLKKCNLKNKQSVQHVQKESDAVASSNKSPKTYKFKEDIRVYSYIFYTVIKTLTDKNFFTKNEAVSKNDFIRVIENLLKNLYNIPKLPKNQKKLIKKDRKIKYMIFQILQTLKIGK